MSTYEKYKTFSQKYEEKVKKSRKKNNKGGLMKLTNELLKIMSESFNYKLNFEDWSKKDFLKFTKDFINGKTEYFMDNRFIQKHLDRVKFILNMKKEDS
tara:strand:- start:907 stop:1203 length:297 start_codon:yes stop_codon:yes gene_type:complete